MGDLTRNFSLSEFEKPYQRAGRTEGQIPPELLWNIRLLADDLQRIRDEVGAPIEVVSGYRTEWYNKKCGGARNSMHMLGMAADVRVVGATSARDLHGVVLKMIGEGKIRDGGVGLYTRANGWVHYDHGRPSRRWTKE
jgi:uncharacterized protein YcbK (DUF882 family)